MKTHLYTGGYIIDYLEGDKSLQKKSINHREDLDDKSYIIKDGDTITGISYKFYGEPMYWFFICDVNDIENPFLLEVGKSIVIPNLNKYEI